MASGVGVQLNYRCSGPILAAIVLFLHKQIKLIETVGYSPVLFYIVFDGFEQSDKCYTALVFY
jgi:hypothetical protein